MTQYWTGYITPPQQWCGQNQPHGPHVWADGIYKNCAGYSVGNAADWHAAYEAKVADFAKETRRVSALVSALVEIDRLAQFEGKEKAIRDVVKWAGVIEGHYYPAGDLA